MVRDKSLRKKIRQAAWDQEQVTDASILIVLCSDNNAWKDPENYWVNAPEDVRNSLVEAIKGFYGENKQIQHDEGMRSCGIAAQTLMLKAKAMGYDSCPMVGFDFEKVAALINLPQDHIVSMLLAIGMAKQPARARGGQLHLKDVMIMDQFK